MNPYIGHPSQLSGAEEVRLVGGRGDGMRLLRVYNGRGLEITVSLDRCADLSRVIYRGGNCGYFSPCGYVAPAYYDGVGNGFLKSFTAGFLTTCGLNNVGVPCEDAGESLSLHGSIGNTPAEWFCVDETEEAVTVRARISDETIFGRKLTLHRTIELCKNCDEIRLRDRVENTGGEAQPLEILYHMNMGYPLLCPESELAIPSARVTPRDERAAEGIGEWQRMTPPQPGFVEQCYFHHFDKKGSAAIYSPLLDASLCIRFDPKQLPFFTQWKMMGVRDYVLGLEPGNCHPDGRAKMRADGLLDFLQPGESREFSVTIRLEKGRAALEEK